jgi:hypothetical protein
MTWARVVALALLVAAGSVGAARAQAPEPGKSATPGAEPWALPAELLSGQPNTPSPYECVFTFKELRAQVEKEGMAARAGAEKQLARAALCKLVTTYSATEMKWVQFAEMNMSRCGIPQEIVTQMKTVHAKTADGRKKLCAMGDRWPANRPARLQDVRDDDDQSYRFGPPTQPKRLPVNTWDLTGR